MSLNFGLDRENDRCVRIRELFWYLLENEAELSGMSVEGCLHQLLENHFMPETIGGGAASDKIGLTVYFDLDELIEEVADDGLHFTV